MDFLHICTTIAFASCIILFELLRQKPAGNIDFLSGVNILFLICYYFSPIFVLLIQNYEIQSGWLWLYKSHFHCYTLLWASIVSFIGYVSIVFGYYFRDLCEGIYGGNWVAQTYVSSLKEFENKLFIFGLMVGIVGVISMFIYMNAIGGFSVMIKYGAAFRSNDPLIVTKWSFLKNIAVLVIPSSYFFFALSYSKKSVISRRISQVFFCAFCLASLIILFHRSGRLQLAAYCIIFPMVKQIERKKISPFFLFIAVFCLFIFVLFGKEIFHFLIVPDSISNKLAQFSSLMDLFINFFIEFTFPFVVLANTIENVPHIIGFRWFCDFPLGILHILPSRLLDLQLSDTVTMVNVAQLNAPIPVDLISFGYYSLGVPGVIIICVLFGRLLRAFEILLPLNVHKIFVIFRCAWMIFFIFVIMYAGPYNVIKSGLGLFVGTAILFFIRKKGYNSSQKLDKRLRRIHWTGDVQKERWNHDA